MPCPSFLSFPSATSSSHTPAGWPGGGVMPPIRDVLLPWLRPDSSSRRISLRRFLNALYACFRSSSVAISRSPRNLFNLRPHRSGYRGLSAPENRIVRSGGDFPSSPSPDPTTEPADRSALLGTRRSARSEVGRGMWATEFPHTLARPRRGCLINL